MKNRKLKLIPILLASAFLLTGCSTPTLTANGREECSALWDEDCHYNGDSGEWEVYGDDEITEFNGVGYLNGDLQELVDLHNALFETPTNLEGLDDQEYTLCLLDVGDGTFAGELITSTQDAVFKQPVTDPRYCLALSDDYIVTSLFNLEEAKRTGVMALYYVPVFEGVSIARESTDAMPISSLTTSTYSDTW